MHNIYPHIVTKGYDLCKPFWDLRGLGSRNQACINLLSF